MYKTNFFHFTDIPDIIILFLLHAILPSSTRKNKTKNNKKITSKYTFADSQNSFFQIIAKPFDLDLHIKNIKKAAVDEKLTIQPFILGIGEDIFKIKTYVTYYDGILCKFDNAIAAFDCCFKLFYVLNLEYPTKCFNFWLFVQLVIFKIPSDNVTPSMLQLKKDFELHLNQN